MAMLEYNSEFSVLVCPAHGHAVAKPNKHLRYNHCITGEEENDC